MRVRSIAVLLLSGALLLPVLALPAAAQDGGSTSTTIVEDSESVGIGDGLFLTGGVITPPEGSGEDPRTFDAYQTAVWVQSWLASAFYGGQEIQLDPPADLPVYRVDSTGLWGALEGTLTVYFATDGVTAYVAYPGLVIWTDPSDAPPPTNWFTPPARVIAAFNGEAELEPTLGTEPSTTTVPSEEPEGPEEATGDTDDGSGSDLPWATVAVVAVVAAGLGFLVVRSRGSRSSADTS